MGAHPGMDALWRKAVTDWDGEVAQFISKHGSPPNLAKFKAYVDPSRLDVDKKVYTYLLSDHAVFVSRLELIREMFAPQQRIASLKQELEAGQAKIKRLKDGLELAGRRKLTYSMLRIFVDLLNTLQALNYSYLHNNQTLKPLSGIAVPDFREPDKWRPYDFELLAFQVRYGQYSSIFRHCGFMIQNPDPPHQDAAPPQFNSESSYSEVYEQFDLHSRALQFYAADFDAEIAKLLDSSTDRT